MENQLVMLRNGSPPKGFRLSKASTVIGRREDCDLRIALGEISRKHCKLTQQDDTFRVEDLGSSNGTYVNGRRIREIEIEAGDTLQMGPVVFILQVEGAPAIDDMHPIISSAPELSDFEIGHDAPSIINEIESGGGQT